MKTALCMFFPLDRPGMQTPLMEIASHGDKTHTSEGLSL